MFIRYFPCLYVICLYRLTQTTSATIKEGSTNPKFRFSPRDPQSSGSDLGVFDPSLPSDDPNLFDLYPSDNIFEPVDDQSFLSSSGGSGSADLTSFQLSLAPDQESMMSQIAPPASSDDALCKLGKRIDRQSCGPSVNTINLQIPNLFKAFDGDDTSEAAKKLRFPNICQFLGFPVGLCCDGPLSEEMVSAENGIYGWIDECTIGMFCLARVFSTESCAAFKRIDMVSARESKEAWLIGSCLRCAQLSLMFLPAPPNIGLVVKRR